MTDRALLLALATPFMLTMDWRAAAMVATLALLAWGVIDLRVLGAALVLAALIVTFHKPSMLFDERNHWLVAVGLISFVLAPLLDVLSHLWRHPRPR